MWRRIHSNRDPRDTLFSELRKEFGASFTRISSAGKAALGLYPRLFFGVMLLLLLASAVLSFTLFRHPAGSVAKIQVHRENPVAVGFGQILLTAAKIRETLQLKHLVDSISAKKQLSPADST